MNPATGYFQVLSFFTELMVDLITICDHGTREILQEFSWMISFSGWLPVKEHDRMLGAVRIISIYPHVCLLAVFAFLMFKNIQIPYNKGINTVAASTFGVLLIHANSDAMRKWLCKKDIT